MLRPQVPSEAIIASFSETAITKSDDHGKPHSHTKRPVRTRKSIWRKNNERKKLYESRYRETGLKRYLRRSSYTFPPELIKALDAYCKAEGFSTRNGAATFILLAVLCQARKVDGVPPRYTEDFCKVLGVDDIVPQWQRMSYHDREELRRWRRNSVGASTYTPEMAAEWELEKEARAQVVFADFREVYGSELVEQTRELEIDEYSFLRGELSAAFAEEIDEHIPPLLVIEGAAPRVEYFLKPLTVRELPTKSEKLARLVALANLYCPHVLAGVAARAEGRFIFAIERELEVLVEMYSPSPQTSGKRRLRRNSS